MKLKKAKLALYCIAGSILVFFLFRHQIKPGGANEVVSVTPSPVQKILNTPSQTTSSGVDLGKTIESALEETSGTYGVVVKNLKTGESYTVNAHREFEPASLYKLWIMATAFNQIENGQLDEDEILSQDIATINDEFDIASESAELTEGTMTFSVKDALEQMITVSHNYAALLLSERLRLPTVSAFLEANNLHESMLGTPPKTTPSDIALFLEKLYTGNLVNRKQAERMLDLLKRQTVNNKLPKYLPKDVVLAHKTGELDAFTHDAGIVFSDKGNYVIVILSESDAPADAEEHIANLSKAVFSYFEDN